MLVLPALVAERFSFYTWGGRAFGSFGSVDCSRDGFKPPAVKRVVENLVLQVLQAVVQAPVVQTSDSAIHRINHYPADSVIDFRNTYPLDSDLSGG